MRTRVKAREDLPIEKGHIKKGTVGEIERSFDLPTGAKVHSVRWEQDAGDGPGIYRNVTDGEFEVLA